MKKRVLLSCVCGFLASTQVEAVTFGPSDGDVRVGMEFGSFVYVGNAKAKVEKGALRLLSLGNGKRMAIEEGASSREALGSISSLWTRSVEIQLNSAAACVSLMNASAVKWKEYSNDLTLGVFLKDDGALRIERANKNNPGKFQRYDASDGRWKPSLQTVRYDITHPLIITYTYDPVAQQFAVSVFDKTDQVMLVQAESAVKDMVIADRNEDLFLMVGDLFINSIDQADIRIFDVSTEPAS